MARIARLSGMAISLSPGVRSRAVYQKPCSLCRFGLGCVAVLHLALLSQHIKSGDSWVQDTRSIFEALSVESSKSHFVWNFACRAASGAGQRWRLTTMPRIIGFCEKRVPGSSPKGLRIIAKGCAAGATLTEDWKMPGMSHSPCSRSMSSPPRATSAVAMR